jgi:spore coat protein U-like protein
MQLKTALLAAAVAAAGLAIQPFDAAHAAGTATTTMGVKITIQDACDSTVAATDMDFGSAGPLTSAIDKTSTITVTCTKDAAFNIGLDGGAAGNVAARTMSDGSGNVVNYQLYSDSGRTTVWGNTVGTDTAAETGTGTSQDITVYGEVPAQTTPPAGNYSDTVQVTVSF